MIPVDYIKTFLEQSPSLAAMILIVVIFLRFIGKERELRKRIADHCHEVTSRTITSIDKNTAVLGQTLEALRDTRSAMAETRDVLLRLNGKVERAGG